MEENKFDQSAMELGIIMGERRAFGMVAGRCSAAQAECIRKVKEEKLWVRAAASWDDYCVHVLKMSRRSADRVVTLLKKHGTLYFEVAALTGISPAEYSPVEKYVDVDGIHCGGEVIALIPANTDRAIEAVARLQSEARPAAAPSTTMKKISELQRRGHQLGKEFRKIARAASDVERSALRGSVDDVARDLGRILGEYTL